MGALKGLLVDSASARDASAAGAASGSGFGPGGARPRVEGRFLVCNFPSTKLKLIAVPLGKGGLGAGRVLSTEGALFLRLGVS